ncbi:MAG: nitroreductase family protein [Oscillospiraceae bacterium]|jgi:nitroreductase|nr:nitroreductase family protein [Oscillospiraceae bacterium]
MLNPELYPAMFHRKSIRKYTNAPFSPEQLSELKAALGAVVPLLPGERFQLELAPAKEGWRVYGYCEDAPLANLNLGFVMQQLDLSLYNKGYGRCWFGMGRAPKDIKAAGGLAYGIALKVGNAAEPVARENPDEFDRKFIGEVIADESLHGHFEAVRLAPSAMNSQPWRFFANENKLHVFCAKPGAKALLTLGHLTRMNQIDMGIALCHAVLALEHAGRTVAVVPHAVEGTAPPAGFYYLLSLEMGEAA